MIDLPNLLLKPSLYHPRIIFESCSGMRIAVRKRDEENVKGKLYK